MMRYLGPVLVVVGVIGIVVGAVVQAAGAVAALYCSVIGFGIVALIAGAVVWVIRTGTHKPGPLPA